MPIIYKNKSYDIRGIEYGYNGNGIGYSKYGDEIPLKKEIKHIKKVRGCFSDIYILTDKNKLYASGKNEYGQYGNGTTNPSTVFIEIARDVIDFEASTEVLWIIKKDNSLWGAGRGINGNQGDGKAETDHKVIVFTKRLENVKQVSCSNRTTWAVKEDDTLWGCGNNYNGQQSCGVLGANNTKYKNVKVFTQRATGVKKVECSANTTYILKNDNSLWGCGYRYTNLSLTTDCASFTRRLSNIKEFACSEGTVWALDMSNALYITGTNSNGCCGTGKESFEISFTTNINDVKKFNDDDNSRGQRSTTWVVKNDGTLWGCGRSSQGQQGNGSTNLEVLSFRKRMSDVKDVFSGELTTWAIKNDNSLWGCGDNDNGQQGNGNFTNVTYFEKRMENVKLVWPTEYYTIAIKNDDTIWVTGRMFYVYGGTGSTANLKEFTEVKLPE